MKYDFIGVQRIDDTICHDTIVVPKSDKSEIFKLREKGNASYRCTKGFKSKVI